MGIVLLGAGIAALIRSGLGVAPFDVANTGLAGTTGWSVGASSWVVSALLVAAAALCRRRPRAGTLVSSLGVGWAINVAMALVPDPGPGPARWLLAGAGLLAAWTSITCLVTASYGSGPAEELMLALVDRGLPLRPVRWAIEAALLGVGWSLGGEVGIGTVVFLAATSPVLHWSLPRAARLLGTAPVEVLDGDPVELR